MSSNTKTLSLTTDGVEFLYSIVNSEKVNSKPQINKTRTIFNVIGPVRKAYTAEGEAIKVKYREEKEKKDEHGNVTIGYVIPEKNLTEYSAELDALHEKKVELTFDRESLSYVKTMVDGVFNRPEFKAGIESEQQITLFSEVSGAVDAALGVKPEEEAAAAEQAAQEQGAEAKA